MKKLALLTMSVALFASSGVFSNAFAQEVTRAQVRQELIAAENNGSRFVSNASYPEVASDFQQTVQYLKQRSGDSGMGPDTSGSSASSSNKTAIHATNYGHQCVGPVSYCNLYFGS